LRTIEERGVVAESEGVGFGAGRQVQGKEGGHGTAAISDRRRPKRSRGRGHQSKKKGTGLMRDLRKLQKSTHIHPQDKEMKKKLREDSKRKGVCKAVPRKRRSSSIQPEPNLEYECGGVRGRDF